MAVLGCGPSFQAVYEGDVRFEHCYALDDSAASMDAKKECWRAWLRNYTYGQSRDRVEYAGTRFSQLSLGPSLPSEEARDARPHRRASSVATPVPTSAFAPPPNLAASASATVLASAQPPPRDVAMGAPGADCSNACSQRWTACRAGCSGATCDPCDRTYRACVPACFIDEPTSGHAPPHSAP
ncbi:MAG: hypothetical protein M3O46_12655 [Myxococcota bacterium]|nr:hypothetical protein [Myxococcota bacterium]